MAELNEVLARLFIYLVGLRWTSRCGIQRSI